MNDSYVECLVARKPSTMMTILKGVLIGVAVVAFLIGLIFWVAMIVTLAAGVGVYFVGMHAKTEYEYLYVDKEITVDKILNQEKRKRVETIDVTQMEIFAPIRSWHLDSVKNGNYAETDYSSGIEQQPDNRYVMIYSGNRKIIFEPSMEFVQAIKAVAPRKVFLD